MDLDLALGDGGERTGSARRDDDLLQSLRLGLQQDVAQLLGGLEAQAALGLLVAEVADAEDEVPLARREGEAPQAVGQRRGYQHAVGRSNKQHDGGIHALALLVEDAAAELRLGARAEPVAEHEPH